MNLPIFEIEQMVVILVINIHTLPKFKISLSGHISSIYRVTGPNRD